jgi:hypothetical protein
VRRAYLDGLEADGTISFKGDGEEGEGEFPAASAGGPTVRKDIDPGTKVINLTEMREQLEKKRGGE